MFNFAIKSLVDKRVRKPISSQRAVSLKPVILALSLMTFMSVFSVSAQDYNKASIALTIDNDSLVGTDREYSSGVYLKYFSSSERDIHKLPALIVRPFANILPLQDNTQKIYGVSIGQQIWTPTDIKIIGEVENDRPYSGLLAIKAHLNEFSPYASKKYSVMIGEVGPKSLAEQAQKAIHAFIDSPEPMGWDNQMNNKMVYSIDYEERRALKRGEGWLNNDFDVSLLGRFKVSNYQSEVAFGGTMRWGEHLEQSFASVSTIPGSFVDSSALSTSKSGYFTYVSLEARYRHNDYTIEGARPKHLYDVSVEHWQSTFSTGMVYYKSTWGAALSIAVSTPNFQEDTINHNTIASLELFWRI